MDDMIVQLAPGPITVVQSPEVRVIAQATQGPMGPGSSGASYEYEYAAAQDGAQTATLTVYPSGPGSLYINGLLQSRAEYSISGDVLSLPGTLSIVAGDIITYEYV